MIHPNSSKFSWQIRLSVTVATFIAATLLAPEALAQRWVVDGELGLATGLQGGNPGDSSIAWERARTRIFGGADIHVDETEYEAFGFRAFVEIEPRAAIGAEVRYIRWLSESVGAFVNVTGTVAPRTLIGGGVGAKFLIPLGKKTSLLLEPSFNALPLGSDLPKNSVLMWALFSAGIRARF